MQGVDWVAAAVFTPFGLGFIFLGYRTGRAYSGRLSTLFSLVFLALGAGTLYVGSGLRASTEPYDHWFDGMTLSFMTAILLLLHAQKRRWIKYKGKTQQGKPE